jgi:hypothetical protein
VAQKFTVPITVKQLASAGSDAVTVYVDQDTFSRLKVEAGGRLTWGSGASAGDVNLYRASADVLQTDDTFKTPTLFVDNIEIDPTGAVTNQALVFNGVKFVPSDVAASGGASLTVSDTAPASPEVGDLWFNSSNAKTYVYYDSSWVEVGASGGVATLDDIGNVNASAPSNGNPLVYDNNTSTWKKGTNYLSLDGNEDLSYLELSSTTGLNVVLGDGAYVTLHPANGLNLFKSGTRSLMLDANSITFGNGEYTFQIDPYWGTSGQVLAFTPGFGSGGTWGPTTPTLDFLSDVSVASPSAGNVLTYNGSAWTAASAGGGGASVTVSQTPPASPSSGNLWFESDTARTYIYYDSFWVEVGGLAPTAIVSDTAPSSPVTGQVWFNSLNGGTYIYYSSAWTEVGAVPVNNLLNLLDAKGDMFVGSADNTAAKLSVGTTGQVLTVDPAATYGVKWETIAAGGGGLNTSSEGALVTMAIGA